VHDWVPAASHALTDATEGLGCAWEAEPRLGLANSLALAVGCLVTDDNGTSLAMVSQLPSQSKESVSAL